MDFCGRDFQALRLSKEALLRAAAIGALQSQKTKFKFKMFQNNFVSFECDDVAISDGCEDSQESTAQSARSDEDLRSLGFPEFGSS